MSSGVVAEATRRSGLVWVDGQPVWHVWHDDAAWVVTGGLEQRLVVGSTAVVDVRSRDRQADLLVRWVAAVTEVAPGSAAWDAVVPLLRAARLHSPDGAAAPERWARESRVLRLDPTGEELPVTDEERVVTTRSPGQR
ncbi:MAG: hypothetical protein Q8R60_06265 [Mycobacteriales bacterium]|nr:hypothetical protein [Mycobacteriales bacterium]